MKHLYFIVEGETEMEFVNRIIIPYLSQRKVQTHMQSIMITKSGGGHGFTDIQHFKNTIRPVLSYKNEPIITTMIDYYGIDSERKLPGFNECSKLKLVDERIRCLEEKLNEQVQSVNFYRFFMPYIQKHELETLLFANPSEGFALENKAVQDAVLAVYHNFPNIEDINNAYETAPSKRLAKIYAEANQRYQKSVDAVDIAELTGIEAMLNQSPRFNNWLHSIITRICEL